MQNDLLNKSIATLEQTLKEEDVFLQQIEGKLAGKIIKIPIEPHIWQIKADHTTQILKDFTKYSKAASPKFRGKRYYSEVIEELTATQAELVSDSLQKSTAEEWLLGNWNIDQTHLDVIKLFLDSQYEPPARRVKPETPADPFNLQVHLLAYIIYQKYIVPFSGFFYPTVNERINFTGLQLIGTVSALIPIIFKRGKAIDGSKKGGGESNIYKAILEATIQFIKEKPDRIAEPAEKICNAFKRRYHTKSNAKNVILNDVDMEVYYESKKIYQASIKSIGGKKGKREETHENSITLNTFKNNYIARAKKEIKS